MEVQIKGIVGDNLLDHFHKKKKNKVWSFVHQIQSLSQSHAWMPSSMIVISGQDMSIILLMMIGTATILYECIWSRHLIAISRRNVGHWAVSAASTSRRSPPSSCASLPIAFVGYSSRDFEVRRDFNSNLSHHPFRSSSRSSSSSSSRISFPRIRRPIDGPTFRRHDNQRRFLNRFLLDPDEVVSDDDYYDDYVDNKNEDDRTHDRRTGRYFVVLPKDDYRTQHAAKVLNLHNGDTIRAGIVQDHYPNPWSPSPSPSPSTDEGNVEDDARKAAIVGHLTDDATVEWIPEGNVKKAEPLKNGNPPGSLKIRLHQLVPSLPHGLDDDDDDEVNCEINPSSPSSSVSLLLALPRPIQLNRMLPMIAQMGVENLILVGSKKVPKDYFGSHLFRKPHEIKEKLMEGLCQAGDVHLPTVRVVKNLKHWVMDGQLDEIFPLDEYARVVTHPERQRRLHKEDGVDSTAAAAAAAAAAAKRMRDVEFPPRLDPNQRRKILLAVGPEGGWEEPDELDMLIDRHQFQHVTMGTRVLRSDCAVVSLLALAHDAAIKDEA